MENDKFFKIPNEYQDAKSRIRIPGQAGQVLNVIERYTFGWNKKESKISFKTFRQITGMDNSHIIRSRKKLIEMRLITSTQKGTGQSIYYRIQTDYTKWKPVPKKALKKEIPKPVPKKAPKASTQKGTKPVPKKALANRGVLKTFFKDILFKDRKLDKIEQLKLRKKELQDDLKEMGEFETKKYLIEGIKEIDKRLKKLGG